jgi:hypothetical protein
MFRYGNATNCCTPPDRPAAHPRSTIDSADLSTFWAALETLLAAHLRYPAMVLHGHRTVLLANPCCARL